MIEELRKAVSLTEVISHYTPVKGKTGQCLFHPDKNPSLSISEAKGLWHCFVCAIGGDSFSFVMKAEGATFPEAVKILSDRYGITQTYNSPHRVKEIKQQQAFTQSKITKLKQLRDEELARLNKCDRFWGDEWKKINGSKCENKKEELEKIEGYFSELDEAYKQMEKWYGDQSRAYYRKALLQSSRGGGVSQI